MRTTLRREGLDKTIEVDSAGLISYHQGEQADPRMRAHASRRGYHITHLSRPVRMSDFEDFDLVIGMDDSNISRLHELAPSIEAEEKIPIMAVRKASKTSSTSLKMPARDCSRHYAKARKNENDIRKRWRPTLACDWPPLLYL